MARVSVGDTFQVILMFRLTAFQNGPPEPLPSLLCPAKDLRRWAIGNGVLSDLFLLVTRVENGGTVAGSSIVCLDDSVVVGS